MNIYMYEIINILFMMGCLYYITYIKYKYIYRYLISIIYYTMLFTLNN